MTDRVGEKPDYRYPCDEEGPTVSRWRWHPDFLSWTREEIHLPCQMYWGHGEGKHSHSSWLVGASVSWPMYNSPEASSQAAVDG
jgi:hypothetical protein